MNIVLKDLAPAERYRYIASLIVPRPIALVTTRNHEGLHNAAPFSFFNAVSEDPPILALGVQTKPTGQFKDTLNNIFATKEFVVHTVDRNNIEAMHVASANIPSNESEIDYAGLELIPSNQITVNRINGAPSAFECRVYDIIKLSELRNLVLGEILEIHINDNLIDGNLILTERYDPIARIYGDQYAWMGDRYRKSTPTYNEVKTMGIRAGAIPLPGIN